VGFLLPVQIVANENYYCKMNGMIASKHPNFWFGLARALLPQLVLLILIASFYGLAFAGVIPIPPNLSEKLLAAFKAYGIPFIAICSFIENLVGINVYFPGAFTILTGMALTAGNPLKAVVTYFAIYLPAFAANATSFLIGRFGKRTQQASGQVLQQKNTVLWFAFTYWHPLLASMTAFSAGVESQVSKRNFFALAFPISLAWSIFWALVIYHFGLAVNVGDHFAALFILYLLGWIIVDTVNFCKRRQLTRQ
jgi:membrane protein DedA with SNARE-associated domain